MPLLERNFAMSTPRRGRGNGGGGNGLSGGRVMQSPGELDRLASMPTRDQALSMLLAVMKAPVEKLARTLNEVPGKLVRTVAAVREQKQASA